MAQEAWITSASVKSILKTITVNCIFLRLLWHADQMQDWYSISILCKGQRVLLCQIPGLLISITVKEHKTKKNKSDIVLYSREQCEELCFTEQEHFPRITDLLSGIRVDRKMQASAQVMGRKSWVTGLGCFFSFCGAEESGGRISKRSNPPLCTESCSAAWPFSRLTVSPPCTTSLLKGWEQPGSEMQFHSLLHNQLYSRMS